MKVFTGLICSLQAISVNEKVGDSKTTEARVTGTKVDYNYEIQAELNNCCNRGDSLSTCVRGVKGRLDRVR